MDYGERKLYYVLVILNIMTLIVMMLYAIFKNIFGGTQMKDYKITNTYQCEFCKDFYNIQDMKEVYVNSKCYDACRNCSGFLQTKLEHWIGKVAEK